MNMKQTSNDKGPVFYQMLSMISHNDSKSDS